MVGHARAAKCMGFSVSQPASQPARGPRPPDMARAVKMDRLPGARMAPQARARKGQSQGTYCGLLARARASADQNFAKFGHPSAILPY